MAISKKIGTLLLTLLLLTAVALTQTNGGKGKGNSSPEASAPQWDIVATSDVDIGSGMRLIATYNTKLFRLKSVRYLGKAGWGVGQASDYTECKPVPEGQPIPACPNPVQEIGMNGIKEEDSPDGTHAVSVFVAPGVANRQYRARIELTLEPDNSLKASLKSNPRWNTPPGCAVGTLALTATEECQH